MLYFVLVPECNWSAVLSTCTRIVLETKVLALLLVLETEVLLLVLVLET